MKNRQNLSKILRKIEREKQEKLRKKYRKIPKLEIVSEKK